MPRDRVALTSLRAFEAAARHLGVRGAATELAVTPGAVSQQVIQLEQALGVPLFTRTARRFTLTVEGQRLAERLGVALDHIDAALKETRAATAPSVLRLRMAPTLAIRWLMPRLAHFTGRHPQFEVELSTNLSQGNEPVLDGVDFAIRLAEHETPGEDMMLLFPDALCPVCTPAMAKRLRTHADLARVTMLHSMLRETSWQIWLDHAGLALDAHTGPRFANAALAYQAALDGIGVAIAQMQYVEADLREGRLVAPFPEVATTSTGYYLVNATHKREWPKVKLFREWMGDQLGDAGPSVSAPTARTGGRACSPL